MYKVFDAFSFSLRVKSFVLGEKKTSLKLRNNTFLEFSTFYKVESAHQKDEMKPIFEKTNNFNLLLNDINKTHSEFKYK